MISRVLRDAIVVLAGEHTRVKRGPDGTELSDKLDVPSQFPYKLTFQSSHIAREARIRPQIARDEAWSSEFAQQQDRPC